MSSWVPLRSVPSESLCLPSTSYAPQHPVRPSARLREQRCGIQSRRGRALQFIRCQASPAVHTYHNAYKLLHQPKGPAGPSPPPDPSADLSAPQAAVAPEKPGAPSSALHTTKQLQTLQPNPPRDLKLPVPKPLSVPLGGVLQTPGLTGTVQVPVGASAAATVAAARSAVGYQNGINGNGAGSSGHSKPINGDTGDTADTHGDADGGVPLLVNVDAGLDFVSPGVSNLYTFLDADLVSYSIDDAPTKHNPYRRHSLAVPDWSPPKTSKEHQLALMHVIKSCRSYGKLYQLIVEHSTSFNTYHACASLNKLIELHGRGFTPREARQFKEGCSLVLVALRRQLPDLEPRSLVVVAYSLARLELPDRELLSGVVAASEAVLHKLQPPGLASLLWAFARQRYQPPAKWMDAWLAVASAQLRSFSGRDTATSMWALAKLRYKMAPEPHSQIMRHIQVQLGDFDGRGLPNLVYSLATSQQHPGPDLLEALQGRAVELGHEAFTPQGMTNLCWSLAKLGSPPSRPLLQLLRQHLLACLATVSPQRPDPRVGTRPGTPRPRSGTATAARDGEGSGIGMGGLASALRPYQGVDLATVMYTLALWGVQPAPMLGNQLLKAIEAELPAMEPNMLCNTLWACARLQMYPTRTWMRGFLDAAYRLMPGFGPADLSQVLWGLARLGAAPPGPWLSAAIARLRQVTLVFSPVEVSTTLWALAALGVRGERLPSEVLAQMFVATDRRLSSFKPECLSSMIWALAQMQRRPDKEWTAEFLKVSYHKMSEMNGWSLAVLVWALAELAVRPPPAWTYHYVNVARTLLLSTPTPSPSSISGTSTTSGSSENGSGSTNSVAATPSRTAAAASGRSRAAGLSSLDLAQIIVALRRLNEPRGSGSSSGGGGGLAKVEDFLREAEERLAEMELQGGAYTQQQVQLFLSMSRRQAFSRKADTGSSSNGRTSYSPASSDGTTPSPPQCAPGGPQETGMLVSEAALKAAAAAKMRADVEHLKRRKETWLVKLELAARAQQGAAGRRAARRVREERRRFAKFVRDTDAAVAAAAGFDSSGDDLEDYEDEDDNFGEEEQGWQRRHHGDEYGGDEGAAVERAAAARAGAGGAGMKVGAAAAGVPGSRSARVTLADVSVELTSPMAGAGRTSPASGLGRI